MNRFAMAGGRSGRVARLCLGGCGCVALLLFARPALATSVLPTGQLVWETPNGFALTDPHGRHPIALPSLPAMRVALPEMRVALSPSGSWLVGEIPASNGVPDGMDLFLTNVNTGRSRPFAQFPSPGNEEAGADYASGLVAFSPDSRAIAFGYLAGAPGTGGVDEVVFMNVATGHTIRSIAIPGEAPEPGVFQWLPNGRFLFLGASGLLTLSKTGTGARPININLPSADAQIQTAAVSPNGSELAMEVDSGSGCAQDSTPCNSAVYVAPTAGGTAIRLARSSSQTVPVWSPDGNSFVYDNGATTKLITVATRHTLTVRSPRARGWVVGWRPAPRG